MDHAEQPELLGIDQVSDGWLKKYRLHYRLPNGTEKSYESISRKNLADYEAELRSGADAEPTADAVSIIATTDDDEILLIKEFRYPMNTWCVAFPAGLIDPGESIADSVERELVEETGYAVKRRADGSPMLVPLPQKSYSSEGMTEECLSIVRVQAYQVGPQQTEPSEFIEVFPLKLADIPRFLEENTLPISCRCQLTLESYANRIGPNSKDCFA